MKKFKVVVGHLLKDEITVFAETKEEAERKVREIDTTTDIIEQSNNTEFFAMYKAYSEDKSEHNCDENCESDYDDDCFDDEDDELLIDELY